MKEIRQYHIIGNCDISVDAYREAFKKLFDVVVVFKSDGHIFLDPLNFLKFFDFMPENFGYKNIINEDYINPEDIPAFHDYIVGIEKKARELNEGQSVVIKHDFRIKRENVGYVWIGATAICVRLVGDDEPIFLLGFSDINSEKNKAKALLDVVSRDPGTDLLNRKTAIKLIGETIKNDEKGALLIIDIDDFKSVNDRLGHMLGDAILSSVANMIKHYTTNFKPNKGIIGRLGGDEFIAYISDIEEDAAQDILSHLYTSIHNERYGKDKNYAITISTGACMLTKDLGFEKMYANADLACYYAKSSGKNKFVFYSDEMDWKEVTAEKRDNWEQEGKSYNDEQAEQDSSLIEYIIDIFAQARDTDVAIDLIMSLVGGRFKLRRSFISMFKSGLDFEKYINDEDYRASIKLPTRLEYKWFAGGTFKDEEETIKLITRPQYFTKFKNGKYVNQSAYINENEVIPNLSKYGIKSLVHVFVEFARNVYGVVAFESGNTLTDSEIESLSIIGKTISMPLAVCKQFK